MALPSDFHWVSLSNLDTQSLILYLLLRLIEIESTFSYLIQPFTLYVMLYEAILTCSYFIILIRVAKLSSYRIDYVLDEVFF